MSCTRPGVHVCPACGCIPGPQPTFPAQPSWGRASLAALTQWPGAWWILAEGCPASPSLLSAEKDAPPGPHMCFPPPPAAVHPHLAQPNRQRHREAFQDRPSQAKPSSSHLLQHHKLYPGRALSRSSSPELGHFPRSGPGSPELGQGCPPQEGSQLHPLWHSHSSAQSGIFSLEEPSTKGRSVSSPAPTPLGLHSLGLSPSPQQSTHLSLKATRAPRVHLFSSRGALGRRDSGQAGSMAGEWDDRKLPENPPPSSLSPQPVMDAGWGMGEMAVTAPRSKSRSLPACSAVIGN